MDRSMPHDHARALETAGIELDDLAEILTRHHGMTAHDALGGIAGELERAGYPRHLHELAPGEALDLVRQVLDSWQGRNL